MQKTARIPAIDLLRGFVIALMALDHTRDFFGLAPFSPEDLAATTPGWFWTRWITHLCATAFILLAGSSAFLRGSARGMPELSRYLLTRGAILIALEVSWLSFSWQLGYNVIILQVLWAIGAGMMIMAALIWLPRSVIALIALALIAGHNALDAIEVNMFDGWDWKELAWMALHQEGFIPFAQGAPLGGVVMRYPLLPWVGLMAAGYVLGPVFLWERARRLRFLLVAACVLLLVFVALRSVNMYGDPWTWAPQQRGLMFDLMSFMRVNKYPPSLLYLCITGAISLALLAGFERFGGNRVIALFGRTPMFFYLIHVALIHFLGNLYMEVRFGGGPDYSGPQAVWPAGYEASLTVVYLAWAAMLALMYALTLLWCRWRQGTRAGPVVPHAA